MKNIIITGANGMIGSLILEKCLLNNDIDSVTIITRNLFGINHPKLTKIIHSDFLDYSSIEAHLKNKDVCFYFICVYTGKVSTVEFQKITVAYTEVFANALKTNSPQTGFCFLSGQGADSTETSKILFAKEKGIAENILLKLGFKHIYIFRPGYIYPVTARTEPNFIYKLMRILYKPLRFIYPNIGVTSEQLADKMIAVSMKESSKIIYENADIRK